MTLRYKIMLAGALVLAGLLVLLYAASRVILLESYVRLEQHDVREHVRRAVNALQHDIENLTRFTNDWAAWDDSYRFVAWFEAKTDRIVHRELYDHRNDPAESNNIEYTYKVKPEFAETVIREWSVQANLGADVPLKRASARRTSSPQHVSRMIEQMQKTAADKMESAPEESV